jgi:large subunit ribosomal protein L28
MSRVCQLTGKKPMKGHSVSHSNVKTKRRFLPNLFTKKFYMPEKGEWVTLKVSTHALRNIDKKGLYAYLKELEYSGVKTGVKL